MDEVLEFPYRPKFGAMLFGTLFFGFCAASLGLAAYSNNKGLIINGLIHLGPQGAITFYSVLSGASVIFTILGIVGLIYSFISEGRIRVSGNEISVQKDLLFWRSNKMVRISDVTNVGITSVKKQRFLVLVCGGKKLHISASLLPNDAAFDELSQAIVRKVKGRVRRFVS